MIFNTIPYVELIQSELDEFDKKVKEKHNTLNPDFPYLTLSPQAEYVLAHGQQDNPQVEQEIRDEIEAYFKASEERAIAIKDGRVKLPEFEKEELISWFIVREEELDSSITSSKELLDLINIPENGSKKE